jgi:hypothetical protein
MNRKHSRRSIISSAEDVSLVSRSRSIIQKERNIVPNASINTSATSNNQNSLSLESQRENTENVLLIWLDLNTNGSDENADDSITKLQHIINMIKTFTDPNACIDYLTDIKDEEVFMIISGSCTEQFISLIQDIPKLRSIYVFDSQQTNNVQWVQDPRKIKGVFTHIEYICDALKRDMCRLMIDLTPISIISSTSALNLDDIDQSFMYTQLLKQTILEIEHDKQARKDFTDFLLSRCIDPNSQSKAIYQFEQSYELHSPIRWYTK